MFYPTPIPGRFNRVGIPDFNFTNSNVNTVDNRLDFTLTPQAGGRRQGTAFRFVTVNGATLPVTVPQINETTTYFIEFQAGGTQITLYQTENNAIAGTSPVTFSDSGSGTFRLTQEGISLDHALEEHDHSIPVDVTSLGNQPAVRAGASIEALSDTWTLPVLHANTSNETRPTTYITFGYIRYRSVRSVELMAQQTNRDDVEDMYYSTQAPTAGLNRQKDPVFDGVTSHLWTNFTELFKRRTELIAADVFESEDGTNFVLKNITAGQGWRSVFDVVDGGDTAGTTVSNVWGTGNYKISINNVGDSTFFNLLSFFIEIKDISGNSNTGAFATSGTNFLRGHYVGSSALFTVSSDVWPSAVITKIEKFEELGYMYLRKQSQSSIIMGEILDDTDYEHEITTATDVIYTLANLNTKKEYTFNRYGVGTGVLQFIGDLYWPDGTASTDFSLEGNGQATIKYINGKWKVKAFSDSGSNANGTWNKNISGLMEVETTAVDSGVLSAYGPIYRSTLQTQNCPKTFYSILALTPLNYTTDSINNYDISYSWRINSMSSIQFYIYSTANVLRAHNVWVKGRFRA